MSCENCGHLSYELAGCQYELGITTSERDTLRQQLAEMTEQRDSFQREGIRTMEQRDKLAGLLELCANEFKGLSMTHDLPSRIDAALAEVNK